MGIYEILTEKQKQLIKYKIKSMLLEGLQGLLIILGVMALGFAPCP